MTPCHHHKLVNHNLFSEIIHVLHKLALKVSARNVLSLFQDVAYTNTTAADIDKLNVMKAADWLTRLSTCATVWGKRPKTTLAVSA